MNYKQFVDKYNGRYLDQDGFPKDNPYQCVDLMRQYCKEVLGVSGYTAIPPTGTAKNIFLNFKDNKYFKKVLNGPTNIPKQGDLIFWGTYPFVTGWAGHVALFDSGDLYTVLAFGQNYPTGQPCKFTKYGRSKILHGYRGILGWLTPR